MSPLAVVGRVHGAVEMGADMHRGVDALRDDADGLQVLRVVHLVAGVADPAGRVHVHDVGHVDDLHGGLLLARALCGATCMFSGCGLPFKRLNACARSISMNVPAATLIGQPVDRAEDLRFLTGAGSSSTISSATGCCTRWCCAAPVAHGRIRTHRRVGRARLAGRARGDHRGGDRRTCR